MNTNSPVLDINGVEITPGCIAGFPEGYQGNKSAQGLVILSHCEDREDGYTVPVYFFPECERYNLRVYSDSADDWKRRFSEQRNRGESRFLFEDENWRNCPFVVFFKPDEIRVDKFWSLETLVQRYFPSYHHTCFCLPKGVERDPSLYQCFLEGCTNTASTMFLYNFWGSVYPMHICKKCQDEKFRGRDRIAGESMPKLKRPFMLADGTPVQK